MKIFLFCCVFLLKIYTASAQITIANGHGIIGEQAYLTLTVKGPESGVTVSGEFLLSNPTVFYPEKFLNGGDSMSLKRVNDSVYTFMFKTKAQALLVGELLAGSDSVCEISFKNITINSLPASDAKGRITSESIGTPLPYVRPASFNTGFPNPASRGQEVTWSYRIDQTSNIRFSFHTLLGKEIFSVDLGVQEKGTHPFRLTPNMYFSAGVYWVKLITNSGESLQRMMVIP